MPSDWPNVISVIVIKQSLHPVIFRIVCIFRFSLHLNRVFSKGIIFLNVYCRPLDSSCVWLGPLWRYNFSISFTGSDRNETMIQWLISWTLKKPTLLLYKIMGSSPLSLTYKKYLTLQWQPVLKSVIVINFRFVKLPFKCPNHTTFEFVITWSIVDLINFASISESRAILSTEINRSDSKILLWTQYTTLPSIKTVY